jgi:hypothetical protein
MNAKGFKRVTAAPATGDDREAERSTGTPPADPRRDPAIALAAAATVAPTLPPTRVGEAPPSDPVAQLNLKIRESLIDQLAAAADREGTTQKVIVCRALAAAGYRVHPDDLTDRGNHRRRRS